MTSDSSLFGDDEPEAPVATPVAGPMAPDWQIAQLREALDRQGVESMADRQRLVEELLARPVASLRELTFTDAHALAEKLAARKAPSRSSRSSWDDRDEPTWIDRL